MSMIFNINAVKVDDNSIKENMFDLDLEIKEFSSTSSPQELFATKHQSFCGGTCYTCPNNC